MHQQLRILCCGGKPTTPRKQPDIYTFVERKRFQRAIVPNANHISLLIPVIAAQLQYPFSVVKTKKLECFTLLLFFVILIMKYPWPAGHQAEQLDGQLVRS
jgi:hypothetical protein